MSQPETPEERRARKARVKAENAERLEKELSEHFLQPLPEKMAFAELQAEHTRLRMKIADFQQMVIQGQLDLKAAQDFERRMVEQIHLVEERARGASAGGAHVPRPGE